MNTTRLTPEDDVEHIQFNLDVTPFISDENNFDVDTLEQHQQHIADDIQLQFKGVISPISETNEPLLSDDESLPQEAGLSGKLTRLMANNSWFVVLMIHVIVIAIALIFGRVDISGLADIPLEQKAASTLPPLKSYLITESEYNKLVERAQEAEKLTSKAPLDKLGNETQNNDTVTEKSDKQ